MAASLSFRLPLLRVYIPSVLLPRAPTRLHARALYTTHQNLRQNYRTMASTSAESSTANKPTLAPSPFVVPTDLPVLPEVAGTDPTRCVLDSFRIAIAKVVADALEPLTVEQVYQGVDYGKKGEDFTVALPRFKLPGKIDELAKKVIGKVRQMNTRLCVHCSRRSTLGSFAVGWCGPLARRAVFSR